MFRQKAGAAICGLIKYQLAMFRDAGNQAVAWRDRGRASGYFINEIFKVFRPWREYLSRRIAHKIETAWAYADFSNALGKWPTSRHNIAALRAARSFGAHALAI